MFTECGVPFFMIESYKTIYIAGAGEIEEKKSKFIANVLPVSSEDEAIDNIEKIRKKNWNASHNCFAYTIGKKNEIQRCSDDGEPNGTAGRPILDVILGQGLHNTMVIVTRYFGGTLLGTGGLARAYTSAANEGIRNSVVIDKTVGKKLRIVTDYNGIGKIQYIACQMQVTVLDTIYTDVVTLVLLVKIDKIDKLQDEIIRATSGKGEIELLENLYFAEVNGKAVLFDEKVD